MAANPDVVQDVIDESTDEAPASRRKVITAIRGKDTLEDPDPMDRKGVADGPGMMVGGSVKSR